MSMGRSEDPETVTELCDHAEALHRAGRLEEALVVFVESGRAHRATEPERLRMLLAQGKLFTDRVFHANRGYDEAVTTLQAASALAEQLDELPAAATALDLLGFADYYGELQAGGKNY